MQQIIIVTGMSGAGKTYALHTLEDNGYYCIDNLPATLLEALLGTAQIAKQPYLAIGIDIRGGRESLNAIPATIERIRQRVNNTQLVYLYAKPDVLFKRYNETRRLHPLTLETPELDKAIALETEILMPLAAEADLRIDTSHTSVYELGRLLKARICQTTPHDLSLMIQSFGFKHAAPSDSDYLFDVRCLPNPYWIPELRQLTGQDRAIVEWLESHQTVNDMASDIQSFVQRWLPSPHGECQRAYLTVSIGCTGGRHRSVYIAERLYQHFKTQPGIKAVLRHREMNYIR